MKHYISVLSLTFAVNLFAFTPPSDITSLLPENNVVDVRPKTSIVPNVDQYTVSGTVVTMDKFGNCSSQLSNDLSLVSCTYSVTHGTSEVQVDSLASGNQAWAKLKAESLTVAEQSNPLQLQVAMIWFMNHIYVPYYRK